MSMTHNIHQLWQISTRKQTDECQFVLVEFMNILGSKRID